MTTGDSRILVVGATGELGGAVARGLIATGIPVRAFGRNRAKLDDLRSLGAEVVTGDLMDREAVSRACAGVGQIFTSANNVFGHGATSPNRVDLCAHRILCDAAREHGVSRLVYVSGRGMIGPECPVDFFRLKLRIEDLVRQSAVPYVLLRPTVFMETWVGRLLGEGIRDRGVAVLFGDGRQVTNLIAVADVAAFAVEILQREGIRNETIEVGGPSNISFADITSVIERELGVTATRRRIPLAVLRAGATLLRPFNEVAARKMSMGYFAATHDGSFERWRDSADRFGVVPITVEAFVARWFGKPGQSLT
jgi:uncharacterized protein YbjT (DUF2867 family)